LSLVDKALKQMSSDLKKTNSQEVSYFIHMFKIQSLENKNDYKKAISYCNNLIKLLKQSKVSYTKERIGFLLSNLSYFNVFIKNFKAAAKFAKVGCDYLYADSHNSLRFIQLEFYAHFYGNNYLEASKCIEIMLKFNLSETGEFRNSQFIYFKAYLLFCKKEFQGSLKLLREHLEIEKDKAGYNISLRILLTMIFIQLNKFYEVSKILAALKKYIERSSKTKEIKQRDILIVKLLRELEKDDFKINEKNKKAALLLAELSDKDKPTAWNYFTPELIPFHEWVKDTSIKK
jgi:tetratricopeptide (TPR) repeat protein